METIVERPAALDVHKAQVMACVRVPDERGRREQYVQEFPTTVRGLLALRDWLAGHGVQQVVMEATGVYWKAPWAIVEDEFDCMLVNARHVGVCPMFCVGSGMTDTAVGAGKAIHDQPEDQAQ